MSKLLATLLVLFFVNFMWSCEKDEIIEQNAPTVINLKNTEDFTHDFKISGDEEGAVIKTQATHFNISEIIRNENTNWSVVYHYKPETGFVGKDYVEIQTNTGSDGSNIGKTEIVKILFKISD